MKQVLVFTGAFNPPSRAHIDLARYAMEQTQREGVVFVPSKRDYIAGFQHKNYAFTDAQRLDMLNQIARHNPWMIVSDYELSQPAQPRTFQTLCALRGQGYAPKLLLGTDKLIELSTNWLHVPEILQQFGIVVLSRNEDNPRAIIEADSLLKPLAGYFTLLSSPDPYQYISSSEIRTLLAKRQQIQEQLDALLPEELNGLRSIEDSTYAKSSD